MQEKGESRKSVSIVGILFDMVNEAESATLQNDTVREFVLENKKLPLDPDIVRPLKLLSDVIPLERKWRKHLLDYKSKISSISSEWATLESFKSQYRTLFKEECLTILCNHSQFKPALYESNTRLLLEIMLDLASLIYKGTYTFFNSDRERREYPLNFCWAICSKVIHHVKFESSRKRQKQNLYLDRHLDSEFLYLASF